MNMTNTYHRLRRGNVIMLLAAVLLFLLVSGCSSEAKSELQGDERTAAAAIEAKGYKIVTALDESDEYILDRAKLAEHLYMNIWSVQEVEPEQYIGKLITTYGFIVSGHPLEQIYAFADQSSAYEYHTKVMLSEGKVIGGYSYPVRKDGDLLMGGVYSIDGKTQEEITGLSYSEWLAQWTKKYAE